MRTWMVKVELVAARPLVLLLGERAIEGVHVDESDPLNTHALHNGLAHGRLATATAASDANRERLLTNTQGLP